MQRTTGSLINFGASHHTAPIEVREKFAISPEQMAPVYRRLKATPGVSEAVVLSTCNRTEIYAVIDEETDAASLCAAFCNCRQLGPDCLTRHGFVRHNDLAVRHLFDVAAGLDSLVVGETEILGQVKAAYATAGEHHTLGPLLNRLFQKTFQAAKWVRTHTSIGKGQISVGTVAVDLALKIFGDLRSCQILLVGAGEISERTITALKNRGASSFTIGNRTDQRAMDLAARHGGNALPFDQLQASIAQFDIVICSTSSPTAVLTRDLLRTAMTHRSHQPLFLIDLALPRDVQPEAAELENVFLYNIDDLSQIAESNLALRRSEIDRCREILAQRAEHFWNSVSGQPSYSEFS